MAYHWSAASVVGLHWRQVACDTSVQSLCFDIEVHVYITPAISWWWDTAYVIPTSLNRSWKESQTWVAWIEHCGVASWGKKVLTQLGGWQYGESSGAQPALPIGNSHGDMIYHTISFGGFPESCQSIAYTPLLSAIPVVVIPGGFRFFSAWLYVLVLSLLFFVGPLFL